MGGRSLDVLEIDAASNTGVDHIRDLRENVRYAPAHGPYKIYVIDEVHMLSTSAFNALLKTLEEPPAHVKFVFATTDPQKIPPTILSRCQRFDLRRIPVRGIVDRLQEIVASEEGLDVDEGALLAIARGAEGGMRDAQSALDQLISFRTGTISEEDVLSVFGLVSLNVLEQLAGAVLSGDVPAAMEHVAGLDQDGKDLERLVIELLEHFRNLLIFKYGGETASSDELTEEQWKVIREQAEQSEPERLLRVVDLLSATHAEMRYALSRRTLLETCLIKAARAATVVGIDELIRQVEEIRRDIHSHSMGPKNSPGKSGSAVEEAPVPLAAADTTAGKGSVLAQSGKKSAPKPPQSSLVDSDHVPEATSPPQKPLGKNRGEWYNNEVVQRAIEVFDGDILDVRDSSTQEPEN